MFSANAILFDGTSALEKDVVLGWDEAALTIRHAAGAVEAIPWSSLYHAGKQPGVLVFSLEGRSGWRLHVPQGSPAALMVLLPKAETYGGWIDRFGLWKAGAAFAAVSAVVLAVVLTAPNWLGPMIPEAWERRMGDAMVGDFERFACHTPRSDAALTRLVERLDRGEQPVDVYVANIPISNAVALPGGKILIFDGLLADAESPEELAGVLAHEIGHVRERHVMQALLRQFGLSVLLSGANSGLGDTVGGLASMSYSREAESEADDYSRARLEAANISPAGTAEFFARVRKFDPLGENESFSYLASHPSTAAREREFGSAVEAGHTYDPALSPSEFEALRQACEQDEEVEDFSFF